MHITVLTKEVLKYLDPKPNENFIDATIGEAGHAAAILESNKPNGKVLGIEWDTELYELTKSQIRDFQNRLILVNDSYANLKEIVGKVGFKPVNGILLDLGFSSWQIEQSKRGFSFKKNEILDMRYNLQSILTAEKIVNEYPEKEIERILRDYGQERFAKQIAKKITKQRKVKEVKTTFELINIIEKSIPQKARRQKIHFATRTFQAIRVAVNGELDNLKKVLPQALEVLYSKGRLVVISFHSLEDGIVKNFFRSKEKEKITPVVERSAFTTGQVKILTKKPITADEEEILKNPRARSAKLRAIIKN